MKKNTIKFNESQLRSLIKKSLNEYIAQSTPQTYDNSTGKPSIQGFYICSETVYETGNANTWIGNLGDAQYCVNSSEGTAIGPFKSREEAQRYYTGVEAKRKGLNKFKNIIRESIKKVLKERSLDDIEHTNLYGYDDAEDYSDEELVKVAEPGDYTSAFIDYLKELIGSDADKLTLNSFIQDMRSGKIRYCEKNDGIYYIADWPGI